MFLYGLFLVKGFKLSPLKPRGAIEDSPLEYIGADEAGGRFGYALKGGVMPMSPAQNLHVRITLYLFKTRFESVLLPMNQGQFPM